MELHIKICGIDNVFDASTFYYRRTLGHSVEYGATLLLNYSDCYLLENISEKLREKETKVSIEWKGGKIADGLELFLCNYIDHEIEPRLQLTCHKNKFPNYNLGPFIPRKRMLRGFKNMFELFRKYFSDLVDFDHVERSLEQITFPDKDKTNIVQYLHTDYEMLCKVLNWYNYLAQKEDKLIISGSAKNDKFQLAWCQPAKCAGLGYPNNRNLEQFIKSPWVPDLRIGFNEMPVPNIYKRSLPAQNVSYILNRGEYNSSEWNNWKTIDVSSYYKGRFVYEINDIFTDSRVGNLTWESRIATLAKEEELDIPSQEFIPWTGIATVKKRSDTDFWMEAELPDFEKDSNIADVRITTHYSGHEGNAGLHLVPEKGTEVTIHKCSNWNAPVVLLNNIRSKTIIEKPPFWKLEDKAKWEFTSLEVDLNDITTTADETIIMKTKVVTAKMDNKEMDIS